MPNELVASSMQGPTLTAEGLSALRGYAEAAIIRRPVLVSSGRTVSQYVSGQLLTSEADALRLVGDAIAEVALKLGATAVAGEESGGIAIASAAVLAASRAGHNLSSFFIRKASKEPFGLFSRPIEPGSRVLIVDDVAGLGNSLLRMVDITRTADLDPVGCMVVVDREDGARARLADAGMDLYALFTFRSLTTAHERYAQED